MIEPNCIHCGQVRSAHNQRGACLVHPAFARDGALWHATDTWEPEGHTPSPAGEWFGIGSTVTVHNSESASHKRTGEVWAIRSGDSFPVGVKFPDGGRSWFNAAELRLADERTATQGQALARDEREEAFRALLAACLLRLDYANHHVRNGVEEAIDARIRAAVALVVKNGGRP
jgi:hypothetical protein